VIANKITVIALILYYILWSIAKGWNRTDNTTTLHKNVRLINNLYNIRTFWIGPVVYTSNIFEAPLLGNTRQNAIANGNRLHILLRSSWLTTSHKLRIIVRVWPQVLLHNITSHNFVCTLHVPTALYKLCTQVCRELYGIIINN
jgi:hypothetical protein